MNTKTAISQVRGLYSWYRLAIENGNSMLAKNFAEKIISYPCDIVRCAISDYVIG